MTRSKDYYQTKVRDGTWAQPDDQEQQIIALQAKLSEFSGSPKFYQGKQGDDKKGKGKGEGKGKNGKKGNEESNWRTKAPPAADKLKAKYRMSKETRNPFIGANITRKKYVRHKLQDCNNKTGTDVERV